jgi:hypothetical protein
MPTTGLRARHGKEFFWCRAPQRQFPPTEARLELEPYGRTRRPVRLTPESIGPYPEEPEVVNDLE